MDAMDRTDADLVASYLGGDQVAFAAIYDRYADRIHNFCHSVLRDGDAAAESTQQTFVTAAERLDQLREPDKLRPWLYSVARRRALGMVRERGRTVPTGELGIIDGEGMMGATPAAAVEEDELRRLVWEAAGGLEDRDRVILDLNLRQGLEGGELAEALEVDRDHCYVLVANLKKRVGRSIGALLVARTARGDCPGLDRVLADWAGGLTPKLRTAITRHVDSCDPCDHRRSSLTSPAALFASVPLVPAPLYLRDQVLARSASVSADAAAPLRRARMGRGRWIAVGAAAAVLAVLAVLVVPGGDDGRDESAIVTTSSVVQSSPAEPEFCSVAADGLAVLGSAGPASPAPADVEIYFRTAAALFGDLSTLAAAEGRAEVQADLATLAGGYDTVLVRLEGAGFALGQVPEVAATLGGDLAAASDRVEDYLRNACGI